MDTKVVTSVEPINEMISLQTRLLNNVVAGIEEDKSDTQMSEATNHIKWLVGHLVSTRYMLANILGLPDAEPYADFFAKGKGIDVTAKYPELPELLKDWEPISAKLAEAVSNVTEEQANQPAPMQLPVSDSTIRGVLTFFMHHEAYHIGQIGIVRKYLGYEAMSYN